MFGTVGRCPKCGSGSVYRSRTGPVGRVLALVRVYAVRCHRCQDRFWRFATTRPESRGRRPDPREADRAAA